MNKTKDLYARNLDLSNYTSRIYYSQNREDLILAAFFPGESKGFYVDVGAYDPDYDSVTKLFYTNQWSGINIEPQPDRFKKFISRRKRDINLNIGISDKSDTLVLRSYANQGLSTFSGTMQAEYAEMSSSETEKYVDLKVEVKTLKQIFQENQVKSIQFLKVDVEGLETQVIKGNDWQKYRPEVICIEENHADNEWRRILESKNYKLTFDDGLNAYYTDSNTTRAKKFDYVKYVVIDRGGGIHRDDYETIVNLKDLALHFEAMIWEVDSLLNDKATELENAKEELSSFKLSMSRVVKLAREKVKKRHDS